MIPDTRKIGFIISLNSVTARHFTCLIKTMTVSKVVRNVIQLAAYGIFIYQSIEAILKYIESPTVVIRTEKLWADTINPRNYNPNNYLLRKVAKLIFLCTA